MSGVMEITLSIIAGQCFGENARIVNKDEYTYNSKCDKVSLFFTPKSTIVGVVCALWNK